MANQISSFSLALVAALMLLAGTSLAAERVDLRRDAAGAEARLCRLVLRRDRAGRKRGAPDLPVGRESG